MKFAVLKQEKFKVHSLVETQINSALGHINFNKGTRKIRQMQTSITVI